VQLCDLRVICLAGSLGGPGEGCGHVVDGLPLPVGDHVGVQLVAAGQIMDGLLAANRLQGDLGLELGGKASASILAHGCSSFVSVRQPTLAHCPNSGDHLCCKARLPCIRKGNFGERWGAVTRKRSPHQPVDGFAFLYLFIDSFNAIK